MAIFLLYICVNSSLSSAASFDCQKARTNIEISICTDQTISLADEEMAALYRRVQLIDQSAQANQKIWIDNVRNRCTSDDCLAQAYLDRISYFEKLIDNSQKFSPPLNDFGGINQPQTQRGEIKNTAQGESRGNESDARDTLLILVILGTSAAITAFCAVFGYIFNNKRALKALYTASLIAWLSAVIPQYWIDSGWCSLVRICLMYSGISLNIEWHFKIIGAAIIFITSLSTLTFASTILESLFPDVVITGNGGYMGWKFVSALKRVFIPTISMVIISTLAAKIFTITML